MNINAIVATAQEGAIGLRGAIPWDGQMQRDMKHFMSTTRKAILIMGRRTADSIKLPLAGRKSIIITTKVNEVLERYGEHSSVVDSLDGALSLAQSMVTKGDVPADTNIFIVGGATIYREAMERGLIDTMYLTTIHAAFDADTHFQFNRNGFAVTSCETFRPEPDDEKNKYTCTFETLQKSCEIDT